MKKHIIVSIIIVAVVGAVSFYGGMQYGTSALQNERAQRPGGFSRMGGNGMGSGMMGGRGNVVMGTILSKDETSITVQLPNNGGSKIIFYSGATEISASKKGSAEDLVVGENIFVNGTPNTDGSYTATSVQLRPALPVQR